MQFTFKRDEEGFERIYIGDVRAAVMAGKDEWTLAAAPPRGVNEQHFVDAIERADEAGFWDPPKAIGMTVGGGIITRGPYLQVTVDIPVADNAVLSVTVGGDES